MDDMVAIIYSNEYDFGISNVEGWDHPFDTTRYNCIHSKMSKDIASFFVPEKVTYADLRLVHEESYLKSLNDISKIEKYLEFSPSGLKEDWKNKILSSFQFATGGTVLATKLINDFPIVINLGGGFHHAKPDKGEGFCIYNDIAIAAKKLDKRVLIVDVDVHQGNGTIVCTKDDDNIFCLSIHEENIYPLPKEKGYEDIDLKPGTEDKEYLTYLRLFLLPLFDKISPDVVIYVAGCDTLKEDPLSSIAMTSKGIKERDLFVVKNCLDREIPIIMTLSGGYSDIAGEVQYQSIKDIIGKTAIRNVYG